MTGIALGARALVDLGRLRAQLAYGDLFERSLTQPALADRLRELEGELDTLDQAAMGLLGVAALGFASWLFLRYRQLPERARAPHWALWSWAVPGLNLIEPYRLVREVWAGSPAGRTGRAPWLLFGWWSSWLAALLCVLGAMAAESRATAAMIAGQRAAAVEETLRVIHIGVAEAALSAVAALLAVAVLASAERRAGSRLNERISAPG